MLALLLIVGLAVGAYAYYHHRVTANLATYLAELDSQDPGWRLRDLEAARATVPDAENSALCVREAAFEINKVREARKARDEERVHQLFESGEFDIDEVLKKTPGPLQLEGQYYSTPPQMELNAEEGFALLKELCELRLALQKAQKLADLPNGRFSITYPRLVLETDQSHVNQARDVNALMTFAALLEMQDGDLKAAARCCRAALNAARSLGDEPMLITQLARLGGVRVTGRSVERLVNQGQLEADDLADFQKRFEAERSFPHFTVATRGERANVHELLDFIECGSAGLDKKKTAQSASWMQSLLEIPLGDTVRKHHPRLLQQMTRAVEISKLPEHQRQPRMHALQAELDTEFRGTAVGLVIPAMERIELSSRRLDAQLNCLITALAVERYRQSHDGEWPKSLVTLVPDLLPAVPPDPADGAELRYCRLPDRVVVYSLLPQKNGGTDKEVFDADEPSAPGIGIAVHLYDVQHRRQPFAELLPPPAIDDDSQ
jgi:hypothetical protein